MESMRRGEAHTSHHQNKVAVNSLETDSNKQSNISNNNNINNKQLASFESPEKETNFEYDDNEWDVGGIGDLLIDLDADIAKSSATTNQSSQSNNSSLSSQSPISSNLSNLNSPEEKITSNIVSKNHLRLEKNQTYISEKNKTLEILNSSKKKLDNIIHNRKIEESVLVENLNSDNIKFHELENITDTDNLDIPEIVFQESEKSLINFNILNEMSTTPGSGAANKATTKMSMDHQATLDKGLKMKIKRTKPGTKTSEAKHEIVKAEQNGTASSTDDSSSSSSGSKKHMQITSSPITSTTTPPQAKRGTSSHRRDKIRDKILHLQREKNEHGTNSSLSTNDRSCNCSIDFQVNGVQSPCSSLNCIKNRTAEPVNTLSTRVSGTNQNSSINSTNSNAVSASSSPGSFSTASTTSSLQSGVGANVTVPSKDIGKKNNLSLKPAISPPIQPVTHSQSNPMPKSQSAISMTPVTSVVSILSSSSFTSSNSSSSILSSNDEKSNCSPPPAKKIKCDPKDMVDICVGTSVGTITEPDCLGPCEPGTSVTLEGIVWHETEGGVLVVNVTWRGKTYVGTLLDCTRHDWAPPRFCDSPTEDLDSRTPKGRGKRGRSATLLPSNDLSNFTETRSSVHSKLRNGGAKGRGGRNTTTGISAGIITTTTASIINPITHSSGNSSTPSSSPTAFLPPRPEKRKSKDECPSPINGESTTQSVVNPVTGLNVQISTKKCKTASPCAVSPVLLECPEHDCSKKYKHANGLKYHQSHAHGSGSMDEDSLQTPESPQRMFPSTTPSPVPPTTLQNPYPLLVNTPSTFLQSTTSNENVSQLRSSTSVDATVGINLTLPQQLQTPVSTQSSSIVPSPPPSISPTVNMTTNNTSTLINTACGQICATVPQIQPHPSPQTINLPSPVSGAGGSITAGLSGQMVQQNILNSPISMIIGTSSNLLGQNICDINHTSLSTQQSQQIVNNGITSTPTRSDHQGKLKPGVLRFGNPPLENERLLGQTTTQLSTCNQVTVRPSAPTSTPPIPSISLITESTHQTGYSNVEPQAGNLITSPVHKQQSFGKTKKNRKSPGPPDYDNTSTSRCEDVQSPAYSDISDDSTPVAELDIGDKSQNTKQTDLSKKASENNSTQIGSVGSYGMYPFYTQTPYMVHSDHQTNKTSASQSPLTSQTTPGDYSNKNKDPPLDLMNKSSTQNISEVSNSLKDVAQSPQSNKLMYYSYNYMPPGYGYNLDPNYGAVSMIAEDNKSNQPSNLLSKDERNKESHSPNEHGKIGSQLIQTKSIKTEPNLTKEIKIESGHSLHTKDNTNSQSLSGYSGIYQRHGMGVQQSQQHSSREDEMKRNYYMFSEQRRSSNSMPNHSMNLKDEPKSPSQMSSSSNLNLQISSQGNLSKPSKNSSTQSQNLSQSSQKSTSHLKDSKSEDKELIKIKQEGQKPTMETQGPPPPPTSQYYLHPSYMSPASFGFDPVYRNMLVPAAQYNPTPYHLQMPRYHPPEDLSRNPNTKALDLLQHHASQYYNTHKIHELSERALKSPTSNVKVSVSSPNVSQTPNATSNVGITNQTPPTSGISLQQAPSLVPSTGGTNVPLNASKTNEKSPTEATKDSPNSGRSPPPQRHVHTHHHTHVGLTYPMYPAPYQAAVLASQQAAAVAVINPFTPAAPSK